MAVELTGIRGNKQIATNSSEYPCMPTNLSDKMVNFTNLYYASRAISFNCMHISAASAHHQIIHLRWHIEFGGKCTMSRSIMYTQCNLDGQKDILCFRRPFLLNQRPEENSTSFKNRMQQQSQEKAEQQQQSK